MLSLDEWCNTVTRGILMNASESALVFVLFIFVANYILLNVMLAIACSEIKKKDSTNEISPKASNEQTIQKNALSTVLKKLMILISFHHKFLFKTIENNYKFDFLKKQKKIQIFEQEDIENYYLIKELIKNSSNNNNTCTIAYKGRTLKLNSFHFLAINKNLEILAEKKINKSQIFIEFDTGSYFEMEGPAMITKKTSYISIFMELFFKKLLSFRSKNKDFENLSDKNIKC